MIKVLPIAIASFYVIVGFANATKNRPEMGNEDYRILKQDDAASSLSMISSEELADFSLGGSLSQLVGYLPEPEPEPEPQPSCVCGSGKSGKSGEPEPEPEPEA